MPEGPLAIDFVPRLRTYVRRRVASSADSDDIVQSVVLRLLEREADLAAEPTAAWMLATARSAIVDFYRARGRTAEALEAEPSDAAPARDESDIVRCLVPLMNALDREDRELLERVDMGSESQVLLAEAQGVSISAMKSRVQRARSRLRELVLKRCEVERDTYGAPTGPASCKDGSISNGCSCADGPPSSNLSCGDQRDATSRE